MTDGSMQAYETLREYWQPLGYSPPSGARPDDIRAFEAAYGIKLPSDFADFLVDCDASDSFLSKSWERDLITFWSFQKVQERYVELFNKRPPSIETSEGATFRTPFADYMYECWSYDICVAGGNIGEVSAVLTQDIEGVWRPTVLASSFTEFADLYIRDAFGGLGQPRRV